MEEEESQKWRFNWILGPLSNGIEPIVHQDQNYHTDGYHGQVSVCSCIYKHHLGTFKNTNSRDPGSGFLLNWKEFRSIMVLKKCFLGDYTLENSWEPWCWNPIIGFLSIWTSKISGIFLKSQYLRLTKLICLNMIN